MMKKKTLRASPPRPGKIAGKELLFLGAITLLGLLLRLYTLNQESLWFDEGYTLYTAQHGSFLDLLTGQEHVQGHPPFYVSALKVWAQALGYQPSIARLFSVIAGTCTIPLLYFLCKKLFDQRTAVIAALLFTLSSFHIYYSQELNSYSLLALEVVLAMFFLVRLLDSPSMKTFAAFTLINIIGLHTHLFYLFVLSTHFLAVILFKSSWKARRMALLSLVIAALLFSPWLSTTLMRDWLGEQGCRGCGIHHTMRFTAQRFFTILSDFIGISQTVQNRPPQSFYVLMSIPIGLTLGIALLLRGRKEGHLQMMALYVLMPVLVQMILETLVNPFLPYGTQSRYLLIIYPAFVILLARGMAMFNMPLAAILMLVLLIPSATSLYYNYTHLTKEDWRGAAEYLQKNYEPSRPTVIVPGYILFPLFIYLPQGWPHDFGEAMQRYYMTFDIVDQKFLQGLPSEFVFVTSSNYLGIIDPKGTLLEFLSKEYIVDDEQVLTQVEIRHYTRKSPHNS